MPLVAKVLVLLVGLLAVASVLPLTQAGEAETVNVVVWTPDASAVEALGAEVREHYGAYVLAAANPDALAALQAAFETEVVDTRIVKGAVDFDTRDGDAPGADAAAPTNYYVVQLEGPVKAEWRAALLERGDLMDYVPYNAFVVRAPGEADSLAALPFVTFVGPYHLAYKLDPRLPADGFATFDLAVWGGEALEPVVERVLALGGVVEVRSERAFESYLRIGLDAANVRALASMPAVSWVEPFVMPADPTDNAQAAWVTQSGDSAAGATVHLKGITGRGQVLADADSGLDTDHATTPTKFAHAAWDHPGVGFTFGPVPNPQHRKVQSYIALTEGGVRRGDFDDGNGHGTHTSGSIGSDLAPWNGYNSNDGQSFGGKFVMMDIGPGGGFLLPLDYFNAFDPTYQVGARLHSNSYGGSHNNGYTLPARQNDEYIWNHQDFLIFRSMGNTAGNTIRPEAVAKNVISSGATGNGGGSNNLASFSSRGPTADGRVKPTVVAPGEGITSTCVGGGYCSLSGTSMSTPTTAGASGLIRQYFQEGWYPGGSQGSGPGFNPSSALVRGVLVNSAVKITGSGTERPGLTSNPLQVAEVPCVGAACPGKSMPVNLAPGWPNGDMGWGLIRLDSTLKFAGDAHGLAVVDGATLATGATFTTQVTVTDATKGLKIVVAWNDAPAAVGATPTLVNDLDLVVVTPQGLEIKGNVFLADPTFSTNNARVNELVGPSPVLGVLPVTSAPGGLADRRNVEEVFVMPNPFVGTYTIKVVGTNVPSGAQPFALVASGGI